MSYQFILGCYTNQNKNVGAVPAEGIYRFSVSEDGKLEGSPVLMAKQESPTYFYMKKNSHVLYACSEPGEGFRGSICGYRIHQGQEGLSLEKFTEVQAAGSGLCHVVMDPKEMNLVAISYPDATIQSYPVNADDSIQPMFCLRKHVGGGPVLDRQESAHAHSAAFSPDGRYMAVCDLGDDMIYMYFLVSETGKLHRAYGQNLKCPAGSGPRHMVFSPDGKNAYVTCELNNEVLTLDYDPEKGLTLKERTSTLNPDFDAEINYPSAIRMTADGKRVYLSNRGEDTIAYFTRDPETGSLKLRNSYSTMGWYPRDFILTKDEKMLIAVNQLSDDMAVYLIQEDGTLSLTDHQTIVQKPVAVVEV